MIRSFENTTYDNDFKEFPKLNYRSISADLAFPPKKPAKEAPTVEGILRSNWFLKYYQQLPSVVLFMATFSSDWTLADWIRREASYTERYNRMRTSLGSRGCAIVFVLVKIGANTQSDKELIEERVSTLKRHIQGENKLFLLISLSDILANSSVMKRLVRNLREFSHTYYTAQYRKAKISERQAKSKGNAEHLFSARYGVKAAFFLEFLGQPSQALQYYRQASVALAEVSKVASDSEMKHQCKVLSSYTNYKICNILFKSGSEKEAFMQFKSHVGQYSLFVLSDLGCAWRHAGWMCDQYLVFLQLLDRFAVAGSSFGTDRVYFLLNAARYASKRHIAFQEFLAGEKYAKLMSTDTTEHLQRTINAQSVVLSTSRFVGVSSSLYDPGLDKYYDASDLATKDLRIAHLIRMYVGEEQVLDHSALILGYLWQAQDKLSPQQVRARARVGTLVADHYMRTQRYDDALANYTDMTNLLSGEKWISTQLPGLKNKYHCEYVLGRTSQFVRTALSYYSLALQHDALSELEQESLTTSIFDMFGYQTSQHLFSDFGQFSSLNHNLKEELPDRFTVDMSPSEPMFKFDVHFSKPSILLGESVTVRINIVSFFQRQIKLSELDFEFHASNGQSIVQQFRPRDSKSIGTDSAAIRTHSLELLPNSPTTFEFDILISDSYLDSVAASEWGLCLERVCMALQIQLSGKLATNSNATTDSNKITSTDSSRTIIFKIIPHSPEFVKSREYFGNVNANLLEVKRYLDSTYAPVILQLNRPLAEIKMLSGSSDVISGKPVSVTGPLKLCQGSIQRVNIDFGVSKCPILGGKVYLSVDYSPRDSESAFFWHPDLSKWPTVGSGSGSSRALISEEEIDSVKFYPFKLNASMQPESPLSLPSQQPGSFFSIPLFVRSETEGLFKIKSVLEYYPRKDILSVATKEFYFEVLFQKPVDVSFRLSAVDNIRKGVGRDFNNTIAPVTTVCRDDILNLAYTIQCSHPIYSGAIKLLSLKVKAGDTANESSANFTLLTDENIHTPSNEYVDVLSPGSTAGISPSQASAGIELRAHELFEMSHDMLCQSHDSPGSGLKNRAALSSSAGAAVGYDSLVDSISRADKIKLQAVAHAILSLQVVDRSFLSPPDLSAYKSSPAPTPSATIAGTSSSSKSSSGAGADLSWLLLPVSVESREAKLKREASQGVNGGSKSRSSSPIPQTQARDSLLGVDPSISLTRVATLIFSAPSVQVIDSPFAVEFKPPTKCLFGETVHLRIGIQNRLQEVAHLQVQVQSGIDFLITGSLNQTIYVSRMKFDTIFISLS